ncbi:D-alanine--D-alanine ligase family protein [Desulfoferula mesophila]|uniref:D-alanine--D-alanine ligase n=1 Tax=Desulfoferula mesophila TaxID=3058419 RepID=A0AAU9EBD8_9BACT|nr:D-alanine--D-alanine ligase [Desulfoferula mesophilus]
MRVSVLHDAPPVGARPDQDDNLVQAREVALALEAGGHQAALCAWEGSPRRSLERLAGQGPDAVFNLVEEPLGRAARIHTAPVWLAHQGLAFCGAGGRAMLLTSHKLLAKRALDKAGLPTPAWRTTQGAGQGECREPWLIKAVWEHGSLGIDDDSLVPADRPLRLTQALAAKEAQVGGPCFAEAYIEGREFNLALLAGPGGVRLLPPAEIVFEGYDAGQLKVVGYRAKWEANSFEYHHTPRRFEFPPEDRALLARLQDLAHACWGLFGLRGWARVDFRVDRQGQPWILEVNANPCLAADAGFAAAALRAGLDQAAVVAAILADRHQPPQGRV